MDMRRPSKDLQDNLNTNSLATRRSRELKMAERSPKQRSSAKTNSSPKNVPFSKNISCGLKFLSSKAVLF